MKQVCTVITVTRGALNSSQSKPSKVKYKCYNTAWLGICLIYTHLSLGAAHPQASCINVYQANPWQLCYNLYVHTYVCIIYTYVCVYIYIYIHT